LDTDLVTLWIRARVYDPSTGRFLSPDPLAFSLLADYRYVNNNPVLLVDPTGHEETFYVCDRLVEGPSWARTLGCRHSNIFGSESGLIYVGWQGPHLGPPESTPRAPLNDPTWQCYPLQKPWPTPWEWLCSKPKRLKAGPKKGNTCASATSSDILSCLKSLPNEKRPPGESGLFDNCQIACQQAADACCLTGYSTQIGRIPILIA
jgi:hypothetical protein